MLLCEQDTREIKVLNIDFGVAVSVHSRRIMALGWNPLLMEMDGDVLILRTFLWNSNAKLGVMIWVPRCTLRETCVTTMRL